MQESLQVEFKVPIKLRYFTYFYQRFTAVEENENNKRKDMSMLSK